MGISSEFQDGLFIVNIDGEYGPEDLVRVVAQGFKDPRFTQSTPVLLNAYLSSTNPPGAYIQRTTREIIDQRPTGHYGKWAIVAGNSPWRFGLARMRALWMDSLGVGMEVFTDTKPALDYLNTYTLAGT